MTFSLYELNLISPVLIVFLIPVVIMAVSLVWPEKKHAFAIAIFGIAFALVSVAIHLNESPVQFGRFFVSNAFIRVSQAALLVSCFFILIFSRHWFHQTKERTTDFVILAMISLVGGMTLVMSSHFLSFFLALELLSIPTYAMIAYQIKNRRALEASVKYILLAGFSISVLLFGVVLLYRDLGTLEFEGIIALFESTSATFTIIGWIGFVLFFCGIAFKVGLVPFHMWLPDVYEGSPVHVTAYLTTISKGAVLIFMIRFVQFVGVQNLESLFSMIAVFAIMSMFIGNLMALKQSNLKRLLAFSSIAQVGYLMVAILSSDESAQPVALFFIIAYFIAILCALGVLAVYGPREDIETIKALEGLLFTRPLLAICLTVALLSFTGLPLTIGFLGKLFVLTSGVDDLPLVFSLVASSAIGFYAYFKVILLMANRGSATVIPEDRRWSIAEASVVVLSVLVVVLGASPDMLLQLVNK